MTFFFETLLGGLLAGSMYSLVAIGFVLIYKASGVFNFAQGSMLLFAALTFVSLHDQGVPFALALLLTVLVLIVGALLIERLVLRPLVNRSQITLFMATLGLSFIIEGLAQGLMGSQVRALDLGIDDVPLFVGPLMLSQFDLIAAAVAVLLVTVLALLFNKTRIGVSLRAVADDTTAVAAATRSNWLSISGPINSGTSSMPRSSARTCAPIKPWARPSIMNDRPKVAMNRVICERLTSGRNTRRSISNAPTIITSTVSSNARANGTPWSCRLTKVNAANSSIAP